MFDKWGAAVAGMAVGYLVTAMPNHRTLLRDRHRLHREFVEIVSHTELLGDVAERERSLELLACDVQAAGDADAVCEVVALLSRDAVQDMAQVCGVLPEQAAHDGYACLVAGVDTDNSIDAVIHPEQAGVHLDALGHEECCPLAHAEDCLEVDFPLGVAHHQIERLYVASERMKVELCSPAQRSLPTCRIGCRNAVQGLSMRFRSNYGKVDAMLPSAKSRCPYLPGTYYQNDA